MIQTLVPRDSISFSFSPDIVLLLSQLAALSFVFVASFFEHVHQVSAGFFFILIYLLWENDRFFISNKPSIRFVHQLSIPSSLPLFITSSNAKTSLLEAVFNFYVFLPIFFIFHLENLAMALLPLIQTKLACFMNLNHVLYLLYN